MNLANNVKIHDDSFRDNYQTENDFNEKQLSFIRIQIEKNLIDFTRKIISTTEYNEKDTIVIKVNLERATDDNFKVFNDFVNQICEFRYRKYVLDLSKALFLDSTFLGSIVLFVKKIHKMGGQFSLVIDKSKIKILQPFDNLAKMLNVKKSVDEALHD